MHRPYRYHSCSMHHSPLGCTPTSLQIHTSPWPKVHIYASSVIFSSKSRPIECRKWGLLKPIIANFPRGTCPWTPLGGRAPLMRRCLDHDVWKGPLSDNTTPPLRSKGWPPTCLLPCYQFAHAVGRVALAEGLLTQLLSSRSDKYERTHRGRWSNTPTIRISGCHSAILGNRIGCSCQRGCT